MKTIHAQKVFEELKLKSLGKYHDLYPRIDVLLLADVFENFRSMCLKQYKLDPAKFIFTHFFQAASIIAKVELDLLNDIDMLLIVEKSIRGRICNAVHGYVKANNKYMRDYDESKESSYHNYWEVNNFYGWTMSQKLSTFNFEWIEKISELNKVFIKNCDKKCEVEMFSFLPGRKKKLKSRKACN